MYYPLGHVQSYQQQPQQGAQLNGVVQHDEILQNLNPSNNNIAVNNVNNSSGGKDAPFSCFSIVCCQLLNVNAVCLAHTPLQLQSQSLSAQQQIIPVDQLAGVGNQNAQNDLDSVSAPLNELDQQNDVGAQTSGDIDAKDDLPIQSENNINDNHSKCLSTNC